MSRFPKLGTSLNPNFRNSYNEGIDKIDAELDFQKQFVEDEMEQQKQRVDNLITEAEQPSEVVDARGNHTILRDRLDSTDAQLAQKASKDEVRKVSVPIGLNDAASDLLTAIQGGTTVEVLSIPRPDSVTPETATFIERSSNLFNKHTELTEKQISSANGTLIDDANYNTSNWIRIKPSTNYSVNEVTNVAFYTLSQDFIRRDPVTGGTGGFETPGNAEYMRVSYQPTNYTSHQQVNEGSELLPYEEWYTPIIKNSEVNVEVDKHNLKNNIVGIENTEYIKKPSNLFNDSTVTKGKMISQSGQIIDDISISISDFIRVESPEDYSFLGFYYVAFYRHDKTFIKRESINVSGDSKVIPKNAYFIRLTYLTAENYQRQINKGTTLLPYTKWETPRLNKEIVTLDENIVQNNHIKDKTISLDKTTFLVESTNIFNVEDVDYRKQLTSNGELIENISYRTSHFIKVKPSTTYSTYGIAYIGFYDKDKIFIERTSFISLDGGTFTTPSNAYFVKASFNYRQDGYTHRRINEGETLLEYESYHKEFNVDGFEELNKTIQRAKDAFMIDVSIDGTFSTDEIYDDYTSFQTSVHTDVYTMYDDLMDVYPNYISKKLLGNESSGKPIYVYYLKPTTPKINVEYPTSKIGKIPKIFITTGVHGDEKASVLTTYLTVKQMCEKWREYPLLEALRFNCEFIIMPVCNPYGYDNNTRKNANLVDINRNMPIDWVQNGDSTSIIYGGTAPLTEIEAQFIKQIFDENPDIDIMYDFHNFFESEANEFLWIPVMHDCPDISISYVQKMAMKLIARMTRKWQREHSFIPDDFYIGYSSVLAGGQITAYAKSKGIKYTSTFEICNKWMLEEGSKRYNQTMCKTGVEAFVNWLLINLRELTR